MKSTTIFIFLILCFSNAIAQYENVLVFFNNNNSGTDKNVLSKLYNQHLKFIKDLQECNQVSMYGAFENGEGVAVFHNSDIKLVRELIQNNPLLKSNLFRAEYFHTNIRFGSIVQQVMRRW